MTHPAPMGHNGGPDLIDLAVAPYGDAISESENWLDGTTVETVAQMVAVDALIKQIKAAEKAVNDARDEATKPLHAAWQEEIARWKPTQVDLERIRKGLLAVVDGFKRKLAEEKAEFERRARAEAEAAMRAAKEAERQAHVADIEAQRRAAEAKAAADLATAQAAAASKDKVRGLRKVTRYEIDDHRAALHDIVANDRDAVTAFIEAYVQRHHKDRQIAGVRVWEDRVAV
jgi:hypothetical protein